MLEVGNYNHLTVKKITASGAFFDTDAGEVFLPSRLMTEDMSVGSDLRLFVYIDSDNRLTATTKRARAVVGEIATLTVKDTTTVGSFLDWGLEKDLLLPYGEQYGPLRRGDKVLVKIYRHSSGRIAASAKLDKFLMPADSSVFVGDSVELIVYAVTDLGAKVVVNNTFSGLVFKSDLPLTPVSGSKLSGHIKRIREDGKIDVTLRRTWSDEAENDKSTVIDALKANSGYLAVTDKSAPDEIARVLRMSKKSFKKAVGGLYRDKLLVLESDGIRLLNGCCIEDAEQ